MKKETKFPKSALDGPSKLIQTQITNETHADIGRLIRAFAEIDDMVTLYICNLAEINESRAIVLLGRTPLSTKIKNAFYLAKMTGKKITEIHRQVFGEAFFMANRCRNTVAHGALLGMDEGGGLAFLTPDTIEPNDNAAIMTVISFRPETIKAYADAMVDALPRIEKTLKLETLRRKRLEQSLGAHPKGQKKLSQKAKRPSQPQSSRG